MLAGHETTANSVTWALYELARHPEFQNEVRKEIEATRAQAAQRGDGELSVADLDSMKYLLALMKVRPAVHYVYHGGQSTRILNPIPHSQETLRYHPIIPVLHRAAGRDDIIPLATPQTTKMGEKITAIPVSKGQRVVLSIAAYNR
jgi:cytochrome P450